MKRIFKYSQFLFIALVSIPGCKEDQGWIELFDGKSLNGWVVDRPEGKCYVEDGVIVGEVNWTMYFLRTEKKYDDFILELDFKVDPGVNSGVQIRSDYLKEDETFRYTAGRPGLPVHDRSFKAGSFSGYQFEIETSERSWTGGFYEEAGRGWLQPLVDDEPSKKVFRDNDWNHMRIKAVGDHFQSWLNGEAATDYRDSKACEGYIGFQLHDIRHEDTNGKKIRFRNIRIREL